MKNLNLLLLGLLILNSINVFSQKGGTIGINGSYNSTWIGWCNAYGIDELDNTKMKHYIPSFGYDVSASLGYNFVDVLGVRAEVGISSQNQKWENKDNKSSIDVNLNYVQIPLMVRFATPGDNFKFHLMLGPQFGFLTGAKQTNFKLNGKSDKIVYAYNGYLPSDKKIFEPGKEDIKERYNQTDLLAMLDLGIDMALDDYIMMNISLRVHAGLGDINAKDWQFKETEKVDYYSSRNLYGGINIGFIYLLKHWY
jgi:hypothetical protein